MSGKRKILLPPTTLHGGVNGDRRSIAGVPKRLARTTAQSGAFQAAVDHSQPDHDHHGHDPVRAVDISRESGPSMPDDIPNSLFENVGDHAPSDSSDEEVEEDDGGTSSSSSSPLDALLGEVEQAYIHDLHRLHSRQDDVRNAITESLQLRADNSGCECQQCSLSSSSSSSTSTSNVSVTEGHERNIIVLSAYGSHEITLRRYFCSDCRSGYWIRPTLIGCLPATANAWGTMQRSDQALIWFDISVLQLLDLLICHAKRLAINAFTQAWMKSWPGGDAGLKIDTLQRQLHHALRLYQQLDTAVHRLPEQLAQWPKGMMKGCLACAGLEHIHSLHFDLCFKMGLFKRPAYQLAHPAPGNRERFIDNTEVLNFLAADEAGGAQPGIDAADADCSNFKADQITAKAYGKYLISALGLVVCRHGHIIKMLNCFTGERHAYATLALSTLMAAGVMFKFWWYDINCRWQKTFEAWLDKQPPEMKEKASALRYPIPPWHLYAHIEACRLLNGHVHMEDAGTGTGENVERSNAAIAPHAAATKYMSPQNRECRLERVAHQASRELNEKLAQLIMAVDKRAQQSKAQAEVDAAAALQNVVTVLQQRLPDKSVEELQQIAEDHITAAASASSTQQQRAPTELSWQAEYAQARLCMDSVLAGNSPLVPPLSLTVDSGRLGTVHLSKTVVDKMARRVKQLEAIHNQDRPFTSDSSVVKAGFAELLDAQLLQVQQQLELKAGQYHYANLLIGKLSDQRKLQQAAMKRKGILRSNIETLVAKLQDWLCWLDARGAAGIASEATQHAKHMATLRNAITVEAVLSQQLPWRDAAAGGSEAANAAAHAVWVKRLEVQRSIEELQLVAEDKRALQSTLEKQICALRAALDSDETPLHHIYVYKVEYNRLLRVQAEAVQIFSSS